MYLKLLLISLLVIIVLTKCGHQKASRDFKLSNQKLKQSNNSLNRNNDSLYRVLYSLIQIPKTEFNGKLWYAKAMYYQSASKAIYKVIQENISCVNSNYGNCNFDSLYHKLENYQVQILRIDPEMYAIIHGLATRVTHSFDSVKRIHVNNLNSYLSGRPKAEQFFVLEETINGIETIEGRMLTFCEEKIKGTE
jgi:hypothetical protein